MHVIVRKALKTEQDSNPDLCDASAVHCLPAGGGEGDSYMKQTGMLVISLRGVNFLFWSRLGCSGQSANILSRQDLV